MTFRAYLGDTMTGLIDRPIDLPNVSWSVSVSDSALATTSTRKVEEDGVSSLRVPWASVPGGDAYSRSAAISPLRRCVVLFWDEEQNPDLPGAPVLFGAIAQREDTAADTSFELLSVMDLLKNRYIIPEGGFGTGPNSTSTSSVRMSGLSYRGLISEIGRYATDRKPGGALPIDWVYEGEHGGQSSEFKAFDVQNNSAADAIDGLAAVPDVQFRPYLADSSHVRLALVAGSDSSPELAQGTVHRLTSFPGGGSLQDIKVVRDSPVMRVYATGSGQDEGQTCHLSEDLTLVQTRDPWPLVETGLSKSDAENLDALRREADAKLADNARPLMQISGTVNLNDPGVPKPGSLWPGQSVELAIDGFPSLPDGIYVCRLMEMTGNGGNDVGLTFDVTADPVF